MIEFILSFIGLIFIFFFALVFGAVVVLVWVCQKIRDTRGINEMNKFLDFIKRE